MPTTSERLGESFEAVFDILEEYRKPGPFTLADGVKAIIDGSDSPGLEVAELAMSAMTILEDLIRETAKTPAGINRRTQELRAKWAARVATLQEEETHQ